MTIRGNRINLKIDDMKLEHILLYHDSVSSQVTLMSGPNEISRAHLSSNYPKDSTGYIPFTHEMQTHWNILAGLIRAAYEQRLNAIALEQPRPTIAIDSSVADDLNL